MINYKKKICIVGTGGFGKETLLCIINDLAGKDYKLTDIVCFMDAEVPSDKVMGVEVISFAQFDPKLYNVVVAIGDPKTREKVVNSLPKETSYVTIIDPNAIISDWVELGEGSIVTAGVIITCDIKIGKHSHLNLHTTIGHDCVIGDYFTTAPGAKISGNCVFGEKVYFGTLSAVRQGISICNDVTIGMGAIVVKNISDSGVYIGNPLRKLGDT